MFARLILIATLLFALPAAADSGQSMRKLLSADEARAWQAVGRLNMAGSGFCTGALIAPDLVLTAAHCMFHPETGVPVRADEVQFLAGWRQGRAAAHRRARRIVVHRDYVQGNNVKVERVAADIAIVELEHPIRSAAITPFLRHSRPGLGDQVMVVSYARDRSEIPSIEEPCKVLGKDQRMLILSCNVNYGASGSPIFVMHDGVPKIASVVSAKAKLAESERGAGSVAWRTAGRAAGATGAKQRRVHFQKTGRVVAARATGARGGAGKFLKNRRGRLDFSIPCYDIRHIGCPGGARCNFRPVHNGRPQLETYRF